MSQTETTSRQFSPSSLKSLEEMMERVRKAFNGSLSMETEESPTQELQVTFVPARRVKPEPQDESRPS